jgi:hypothetical protein
MILICLVVEATSLLIVKIGTMYAAYAAARSCIVWQPTVASSAQERMELAGKQAMVPFSSSLPFLQVNATPPGGSDQAYMAAYRKYAAGIPPRQPANAYWTNRYNYAWSATRVTQVSVTNRSDPGTAVATPMYSVSVAHDAPLITPLIGRILGSRQVGSYWVREIKSQITLPAEATQRIGDPLADNPPSQPLGITYQPNLGN